MDKSHVVAIRDLFKKAKFTWKNRYDGEPKQFEPEIHICCDNSLNAVDDGNGSVIWDDNNSRFYWFKFNGYNSTPNSPTMGQSMGSRVGVPAMVIGVDYDEIQNMRISMNAEMFENLLTQMTEDGIPITDDQKNYLRHILFIETDMDYIIRRKQNVSYMTETSVNAEISQRHYTEDDEYSKTIHTM